MDGVVFCLDSKLQDGKAGRQVSIPAAGLYRTCSSSLMATTGGHPLSNFLCKKLACERSNSHVSYNLCDIAQCNIRKGSL